MTDLALYSYWRSTTAYRVRIALNLKGVRYDIRPVNLVEGAQHAPDYVALNPGHGVPTLVLSDGTVLTQSLAILDWLDSAYPAPPLLPHAPVARAKALAIAHQIALDVHPVNNLKVIQQLKIRYESTAEQNTDWMKHWMLEGFAAVEALLPDTPFAAGDSPMFPDICLIAQLYNAGRWGVDMSPFTKINSIYAACMEQDAFIQAHPDNQPDAT